jgi:hypothetical protein
MGKVRFTHSRVKRAIKGSGGIRRLICTKLGISRQGLYECLKKWPDLKQELQEEQERKQEEVGDMAENVLYEHMFKHRSLKAVMYFLSNSKEGRRRGYGNGAELQKEDVTSVLERLTDNILQGGPEVTSENV